MSVSAALQRFREIEKLTAEARALEEQQLALLEAQRISSLHNRASNPPLPGTSPTVKVIWPRSAHALLCRPGRRAAWVAYRQMPCTACCRAVQGLCIVLPT